MLRLTDLFVTNPDLLTLTVSQIVRPKIALKIFLAEVSEI